MKEENEEKIIKRLTILFLFITAVATLGGAIIGGRALIHYENANNTQMTGVLYNMDAEINSKLILDKPYLQAIYAHSKDEDKKLSSIKILQLFIDNHDKDTITNNWKDIPDLFDKLFETDDFNNLNKQRLRTAYFALDNILYMTLNAYEANYNKIIKYDDYETYAGYFSEVGQNPLFLCAVYCGHRYGYLTERFAKELKEKLKEDPEVVKVITEIYPDLLSDNWVKLCGKKK